MDKNKIFKPFYTKMWIWLSIIILLVSISIVVNNTKSEAASESKLSVPNTTATQSDQENSDAAKQPEQSESKEQSTVPEKSQDLPASVEHFTPSEHAKTDERTEKLESLDQIVGGISVSSPTEITTEKVTITKEEYDKINFGMTYNQVVEIIGGPGVVLSEDGVKESSTYSAMYYYQGDNSQGSSAIFSFKSGRLKLKNQMGLE